MTKTVKLGEICKNLDGKRIPLNDLERRAKSKFGLYPYVGANNIVGYLDEFIFDEKILCVAEDGGSWGSNQKCAFIMDEKCWVNNHAHVLSAKANTSLEYLMYYLNYKDLNSYITGSTRGKLNKSALERIEIPLPALPEQRRIAALLDHADALRQKDRQLLAHYDKLAQSVFLDLFGDPVRNEKGWEVNNLGNLLLKVQIGPFGSLLHVEDYISGGIPLVNPTHISDRRIFSDSDFTISPQKHRSLSNYHLQLGDVIMGRRGEMGRCALVTDKESGWLCGTGSLYLRPNKKSINSIFLTYVMSSSHSKKALENDAKGQTMMNLNQTVINNFRILVPPLPLQTHFASVIEQIERQKAVVRQQMAASESLFGRLLQESFG